MENVSLRYHYGNFIRAIEQQAKFWEPHWITGNDPAGIRNFPRELLAEATIWRPNIPREKLPSPTSSVGDNENRAYLANKATSQAENDEMSVS